MTQHSEQLTRDGDAAQDLGAPEPRWSPRRAAVLGAGSWGTTFAKILTDAGLSGEGPAPEVVLWGRDAEAMSRIARTRVNERYVPGTHLPDPLQVTADLAQALSDAQDHLARGGVVVIYPEGTLTRDPLRWPMHAYPGAARLALGLDVPVIPIAHWGDQQILGRDSRWRVHVSLRPRRPVRVRVGEPVDLSRFRSTRAPGIDDAEPHRDRVDLGDVVGHDQARAVGRDPLQMLDAAPGQQPVGQPHEPLEDLQLEIELTASTGAAGAGHVQLPAVRGDQLFATSNVAPRASSFVVKCS